MKELDLSPRLSAIAGQVPQGAYVVDVGTDHAYLPIWLLKQGRVDTAIAADLREGPLSHGKQAAEAWEVVEKISFRCCNGLEGIHPNEVDTIVIAGMGGETIAQILKMAPWTKSERYRLLLQPMSSVHDLRAWLPANGFRIEREEIVAEGEKYYVIFTVRAGRMDPLTRGELWGGRQSREMTAQNRLAYLNYVIERRERALQGMEKAAQSTPESVETRETLQELYQLREEWISWKR